MKHLIGLILVTTTLLACKTPAYISGRIEGAAKKNLTVYLIEPVSLRDVAASYFGKVIDSAVVKTDGSFEFHHPPTTKEPVLLELAVQPTSKYPNYLQTDHPDTSNYMPIVWQLGETLKITAKLNEFQKSFSMEKPSDNNQALLQLRDINLKAYHTYLAGKQWQVEDGSQLMEKEEAILNYQRELMKFADSTTYMMPALVALRWVSPINYYERMPEFLVRQCHKWSKKQAEHPWVKQLCRESNPTNLPVLVDSEFPNLQFNLITKDTLNLKDLLGKKLTIIDVWASWCAPCRKENRQVLVPLWDKYHEAGLQIIGYSLESEEAIWKAASEHDGANRWVQASDLKGDDAPLLKEMRIQTIPANFILDAQGRVIAKNLHGTALEDSVKLYMEK